jgi:hypothetical protein
LRACIVFGSIKTFLQITSTSLYSDAKLLPNNTPRLFRCLKSEAGAVLRVSPPLPRPGQTQELAAAVLSLSNKKAEAYARESRKINNSKGARRISQLILVRARGMRHFCQIGFAAQERGRGDAGREKKEGKPQQRIIARGCEYIIQHIKQLVSRAACRRYVRESVRASSRPTGFLQGALCEYLQEKESARRQLTLFIHVCQRAVARCRADCSNI